MNYPDDSRIPAPKPDWERTLAEGVELIRAYRYCGPDEVARLVAELATLRRKGNAYAIIAGILRGAIPRILAAMQGADHA